MPITDSGDDVPNILKENNFFPGEEQEEKEKTDLEKDNETDNAPLPTDSVIEESSSKVVLSSQEPKADENKDCTLDESTKEAKSEGNPPVGMVTKDSGEVKDLEGTGEKSQRSLVITDIFTDDLTGGCGEAPTIRGARTTEDMIPGGVKTKDEKADMITEQLLFYLKMEMMTNIFPQRVNVTQ